MEHAEYARYHGSNVHAPHSCQRTVTCRIQLAGTAAVDYGQGQSDGYCLGTPSGTECQRDTDMYAYPVQISAQRNFHIVGYQCTECDQHASKTDAEDVSAERWCPRF